MADYRPALASTLVLETPSAVLNEAWLAAKDNIARTMRYYTLGWGMSNAPHLYAIVVGRDTGWMSIGCDYVAPWFAPAALTVFRDRQKPNGQILEYVDLETGATDDYGLNIADNTPLYAWAVHHHYQQYADENFRAQFRPSMQRAGDYLLAEITPSGLLSAVPAGTGLRGLCTWRNVIDGHVIAGEVTETNCLSALALDCIADFTGDTKYAAAAAKIRAAVNAQLWTGTHYRLTRYQGNNIDQVTGDNVFPIFTGAAPDDRARTALARLAQKDFWTARGMRTIPNTNPQYNPGGLYGLLGGVWPNLTLWYAAAVARFDATRALEAIETVARPVVDPPARANVTRHEFAEYFDGDTDVNIGMHLSPWVAPTLLWTVLEGLLGLRWKNGVPTFAPHWPKGWKKVTLRGLPTAAGARDFVLEA